MDLRHLRHLVALADECHFARAAERVHLSQPAFSRSIQTVERDLGLTLFDRHTGDVRPTPAGSFVIERARRLLFDARCMERDVNLYRDSALGDTAFGVGPFPAATLALQVLPELRRQHPQVGLRVEVSNWQLLLERLNGEDIEFFVADVRSFTPDAALDIESLGRQCGNFYVRRGHPLAGGPCTLAEVWDFGVAATRLPQAVRSVLAKLLGMADGQQPALALECDDVSALCAVAMSTDTALAATDAAVLVQARAGLLVPLQITDLPQIYSEMGVVRLRQRTPSPMAQAAIACFRRVAATVNLNPP